jgi:N-acetylmuramoyl-L-alanine amidase
MKTIQVCLLILLSTFVLPLQKLSAEPAPFELVIDPGHGGNDVGAAKNNLQESQLVLEVAYKIKELLIKNSPEIVVHLTRQTNRFVTLEDRIKNRQPHLFISLHANSSISNQVVGMETYFQPDQTLLSQSLPTAAPGSVLQTIVEDLETIGKTKHSYQFSKKLQSLWSLSPSVIRRSSFFVVEKTKFPSVLVEIGFLTNPVEAQKLASSAYQNAIAETIVSSVIEYKKSVQ